MSVAAHIPFEMNRGENAMVDPGNGKTIKIDRSPCLVPLVSTAAETRTLARAERAGKIAILSMKTDGGDITVTVTGGYDQAGTTTLVFNDAGDFAVFVSIANGTTIDWRLVSINGINLATAAITTLTATTANITTGNITTLAPTNTNASVGASTAAAGTTTSDAGALPAGTAMVYPTTAADGTKGVKINAADQVTGRMIMIGNGVSNQILKVYGPTGAVINGAAADAAFSSDSGKGVIAVCLSGSGNTWLMW